LCGLRHQTLEIHLLAIEHQAFIGFVMKSSD